MAKQTQTKTNQYPQGIDQDEFRHIQILVKTQNSISGSVDELKKQITKTSNNIKDAFTGGVDEASDAETIKKIGSRTKKLTKLKTIYGIALPLPNELSESQSHQWEQTNGVSGDVGEIVSGIKIKGINIAKLMGEGAGATGMRKPLIDPGYFQDYKGTEPRSFTFSWDLIPNNQDEADNILAILYNLKKFTLPKATVNGMSLLSPYMFELKIGNPMINSIMNMNNVVCTSMDINYSGNGALQMFDDGMPKFIKLSLSFTERSTVTSDFY